MFFTTYAVDTNICYETCRDDTYYNATIVIISALYHVKIYDERKIILEDRKIAGIWLLPGIFCIKDDTGIREFNMGGYINSRVTIYGFDGLFKGWGLYTVLIGKCEKIEVQTFR